jgi:hypothetical protein
MKKIIVNSKEIVEICLLLICLVACQKHNSGLNSSNTVKVSVVKSLPEYPFSRINFIGWSPTEVALEYDRKEGKCSVSERHDDGSQIDGYNSYEYPSVLFYFGSDQKCNKIQIKTHGDRIITFEKGVNVKSENIKDSLTGNNSIVLTIKK